MKCAKCGAIGYRHFHALLCCDCAAERVRLRARTAYRAHHAVKKEVDAGRLPQVTTLLCVDCGKQAFCYDHRDYRRPLDVDPVCKSCDVKRGAGAPYDGLDPRWAKTKAVA